MADPTRLVLDVSGLGITGFEGEDIKAGRNTGRNGRQPPSGAYLHHCR